MNSFDIDMTQFDGLAEGKEVIYAYDGQFSYQHLTQLCNELSRRLGREVQWAAEPSSPYALPRFRISLANTSASKRPTQEFDYTPFDDLKSGRQVLYQYSKTYYIRHLNQLCKRLSEHYRMRVEWDGSVLYNLDGTIRGFVLQPASTKYPHLLDSHLKKFRFELDFYNDQGEIVHVHHGHSPARMPLEWYFHEICQNIQLLGHGSVRIRPNKTAKNYFGRPASFISALYEAVDWVGPDALNGIVAIFPKDDESIWAVYRRPNDDYWGGDGGNDWDDDPPQSDPSPDGGIELIVGDIIPGKVVVKG